MSKTSPLLHRQRASRSIPMPTQGGQTLCWILFLFKGKVNTDSKHFHVYFVYSSRGQKGGYEWFHKSLILILFDSVIIKIYNDNESRGNNIWFDPKVKLFSLILYLKCILKPLILPKILLLNL